MVLWVFHRTPAQEKRLLQIQGNGRRLTISFSRQHTLTIACHERKLTLLRYHNRQPWPRHISAAALRSVPHIQGPYATVDEPLRLVLNSPSHMDHANTLELL